MLRSVLSISRCSVSNLLYESFRASLDTPWRAVLLSSQVSSSHGYHTTPALNLGRNLRRREGGRFEPKKLQATGEGNIPITGSKSNDGLYPDETTPTKVFDGIMYKDIPIINVRATPNNTLMLVADAKGSTITSRTCGAEGFRNARKSTNVAAQATGYALGKKIMQKGIRTVRARVHGLGAGRLASLKGLTLAGLNIVSITDNTAVSWNPPRPRKQRRL